MKKAIQKKNSEVRNVMNEYKELSNVNIAGTHEVEGMEVNELGDMDINRYAREEAEYIELQCQDISELACRINEYRTILLIHTELRDNCLPMYKEAEAVNDTVSMRLALEGEQFHSAETRKVHAILHYLQIMYSARMNSQEVLEDKKNNN